MRVRVLRERIEEKEVVRKEVVVGEEENAEDAILGCGRLYLIYRGVRWSRNVTGVLDINDMGSHSHSLSHLLFNVGMYVYFASIVGHYALANAYLNIYDEIVIH